MMVWFNIKTSVGYEAETKQEAFKRYVNEEEPDGISEIIITDIEIEDDEEED
jgi:transcription antitermination factor NusG